MNYDKHLNIRISQEQLDWLDEMTDRDETHETCISTIIRDLIDKAMHEENVIIEEGRKYQEANKELIEKNIQDFLGAK